MLVFVEIHHTRAAPHLHEHMRFLHGMSRKHAAVFAAPIVNLLDEAVDEEMMHCVPVFISERIRAVAIYEEFSEFFPKIDIVFFFEIRYQNGRISSFPSVILRLVGEKSEHISAEIFSAFLFVSFMSKVDEFTDYRPVENIDDGRIGFKIHVNVFPVADRLIRLYKFIVFADEINRGCIFIETARNLFVEVFFVIGFIFEKLHARKPARPAVFVVTPGVHIDFFALFDAGSYAIEPSFAEVFGFKPAARVHEKTADTLFLHFVYLSYKLFGLKIVVPAPERNGTIIS